MLSVEWNSGNETEGKHGMEQMTPAGFLPSSTYKNLSSGPMGAFGLSEVVLYSEPAFGDLERLNDNSKEETARFCSKSQSIYRREKIRT